MPDWIAVILLGVIEGITEFLPISSTGHLLIAERWLPKQTELFKIVIQSGAVLAVIPLFRERLRQFLFQWREKPTQDYALKILAAFFFTGVGGLTLKKLGLTLPETILPIALALLAGGAAFLVIEHHLEGKPLTNEVTWTMALAVGVAQLIAAAFPGVSRSGGCILFLLLLGLGRPLATEFAFLVGIPTMLAAGAYEVFTALHQPPPNASPQNWPHVALGFVASAIVSFIVVKWLLRYVQTHTFTVFGWYRIGLAAVLFLLLLV